VTARKKTTVKVYHASSADFRWPTLRVDDHEDRHPNGLLGVWCAVENAEYLSRFGEFAYEFTLSAQTVFEDLPLHTLAMMSGRCSPTDYLNFAADCRKRGTTALRILEKDGVCQQMVLLDPAVVASCRKCERA